MNHSLLAQQVQVLTHAYAYILDYPGQAGFSRYYSLCRHVQPSAQTFVHEHDKWSFSVSQASLLSSSSAMEDLGDECSIYNQ